MSIETEQDIAAANKGLMRLIVVLAALEGVLMIGAVTALVYDSEHPFLPPWAMPAFFIAYAVLTGLLIMTTVRHMAEKQRQFWVEVSEECGYTYVWKPYFQNEPLRFREGRNKATRHGLMGTLRNQAFRLFQYSYMLGHGKQEKYRFFAVIEVVFSGNFPHCYLNNVRNLNLDGMKELFLHQVRLPSAFDSAFKLYVPEGYEIEALEIFTPEILALLLDEKWQHDVELVGDKLYIFREKNIDTKIALQQELAHVGTLVEALAPRLNRFSFAPVGDLKHTL